MNSPQFGMEKAIEVMETSIQEPREDGVISPQVGAVAILPDGSYITACRGELRQGDHAEYTLLERKLRDTPLDEAMLFVTLEPCAPAARKFPKISCAERIVNARIPKVWVGIEDPDPKVDRRGIQYLIEQGVEVEMFNFDLQEKIRKSNDVFIEQAKERAKCAEDTIEIAPISALEYPVDDTSFEDLSIEALALFSKMGNFNLEPNSQEYKTRLVQLGFLRQAGDVYVPTGYGLLLFGERPQLSFPQAKIKTILRVDGKEVNVANIEGNLAQQARESLEWFRDKIGGQIDRSEAQRRTIYDYPEVVVRESIVNAIIHRDYSIEGASVIFEINDDAIIIKSPGSPIAPVKLEQIESLKAPTLSRSPKITYVFNQLELSEERGLGFETLRSLPTDHQLPLPVIEYDSPYLVFTFPRKAGEQQLGLDYIRINNGVSRQKYAEFFNLEDRTAGRRLKELEEKGLIERVGSGPATTYKALA